MSSDDEAFRLNSLHRFEGHAFHNTPTFGFRLARWIPRASQAAP